MSTPHEREREARERVVRPRPNHERADAYAQELCVDAMYDGTLKSNLAAAYLALKQENLDLSNELEMARRIIRESGTTYPYKAKTFGGNTHWYNTANPSRKP